MIASLGTDPSVQEGSDVSRRVHLSAFILTYNEERNLEECLKSLVPWCKDIFVIDSFSTDRTLDIAARYGAKLVQNRFEGHAKQWTWAIQNAPFENEWVFALDADHRVTAELAQELRSVFREPPFDVAGFYVKRRQVFRGKWIRFGGYYPKYMLKIFRHGAALLDEDEFDFRFYVKGKTRMLKHDIVEANANDERISFFIEKHNGFATKIAIEELKRESGGKPYLVRPSFFGTPDQRTLWLKVMWGRMPAYTRAWLMFVYRYILRLGFLDGKQGFIFHFLQTLWFRILVDVRKEELRAEAAARVESASICK